jgi:hypothetical protein
MNNWNKIFATRHYPQAMIIKGMLEENQIPVQVLNKQDSSYPMLGEIQLFVPFHLSDTAKQLINGALMN